MRNPIIKIKQWRDSLILIMGIPILARWHLYIEMDPTLLNQNQCFCMWYINYSHENVILNTFVMIEIWFFFLTWVIKYGSIFIYIFFRLHIRALPQVALAHGGENNVWILICSLQNCIFLLGDSREVTHRITSKFCDDNKDTLLYIM